MLVTCNSSSNPLMRKNLNLLTTYNSNDELIEDIPEVEPSTKTKINLLPTTASPEEKERYLEVLTKQLLPDPLNPSSQLPPSLHKQIPRRNYPPITPSLSGYSVKRYHHWR